MIKLVKGRIEMEVRGKTQAFPFLRSGWTEIHSGKKDIPIKEPEQTKETPVAEQSSVDAQVVSAEEEKPRRGRKPATKAE